MQKRRTHHFRVTLAASLTASCLFPLLMAIFGKHTGVLSFSFAIDCIFAMLALAAASFLIFSFLPYFRGDKRWYSISALLTVAFFAGAAVLWQLPLSGAVI